MRADLKIVEIKAFPTSFPVPPENRVIEDGAITILQPDLSKTGGLTEVLRIAAMASACKLPLQPHSSLTGLNHAASIHFLAAIDNGGYFEGDVSKANRFRDELGDNPRPVGADRKA